MVRDPAPAAAVAMARRGMSLPPTPPHRSDFALGSPNYDVMVRDETPLAAGEPGCNTNMFTLGPGAAAARQVHFACHVHVIRVNVPLVIDGDFSERL
jgi:hypothetical protein